ncbi:hypothetical protein ACFL0V_02460 [Nanoarchaeota archaeon]
MTVISIVGTTGVGKSLLVKQLAAATCSPAFFEGEEGTIPKEILENIKGGNPTERWGFFLDRYKKNLERAKSLKMDCYVDGAVMSAKATLVCEKEEYKEELSKMIDDIAELKSDIVVLLTASEEKIKENMEVRARVEPESLERAMKIQKAFIELGADIIIDRSEMDFTRVEDVDSVLEHIEEFKEKV